MEKLKTLSFTKKWFFTLIALLAGWFLVETVGMLTNWIGWWHINSMFEYYLIDYDYEVLESIKNWELAITGISRLLFLVAVVLLTVYVGKVAWQFKQEGRLLLSIGMGALLLVTWLGVLASMTQSLFTLSDVYDWGWDAEWGNTVFRIFWWGYALLASLFFIVLGGMMAFMCGGRLRLGGVLFILYGFLVLIGQVQSEFLTPVLLKNDMHALFRLLNIALNLITDALFVAALGIGLGRKQTPEAA